ENMLAVRAVDAEEEVQVPAKDDVVQEHVIKEIATRTSWNEFSFAMASALICLSSGQRFNFSKYIFESLVRNVDSTSKFYMYPRVRKGFPGVETPLFENMLAVRAVDAEEEVQVPAKDDVVQEHVIKEIATEVVPPTPTSPSPSSPVIPSIPPHQSPSLPQPQAAEGSSHLGQQVLEKCSALVLRVEGLENANAAQQLEIIKLKDRVKKLERLNKGRISVDMEMDEGIELEEDTEVQEAVEVVTTAKLITEVVTTAATQVATASTPIPATKPKVLKIAAALVVSTRKRKGVVIRDPEEELHIDTLAETLFLHRVGDF
nr:synaptobrevin, longin-like domain protein [Tanacetum cinerariifolium]